MPGVAIGAGNWGIAMPVSIYTARGLPDAGGGAPDHLRPYAFHGIDLTMRGGQAIGDCPFCMAEGKFTVHVETGLWRCFVCGGGQESGGGNALTFLRAMHATASDPGNRFATEVATDRRLCDVGTPLVWGVCRSLVPPHYWIVPGYGVDGTLTQLYKRVMMEGKWCLLPTPGIHPDGRVHAMHLPATDFDPKCAVLYVCEGPWDGMALWEVARGSRMAPCQVLAVPGCNVWRDDWTAFCQGKHITLMYDSDHPRVQGTQTFRSGLDGMKRVARKLSGHAAVVRYLHWGEDGFDPSRPDGWDVRDALSGAPGKPLFMVDRRGEVDKLLLKVQEAPPDWFSPTISYIGNGHSSKSVVEALQCQTWNSCLDAWCEAMRWRRDMSDMLAVVLAVCASTNQSGNQLFVDVVGSPGSGKTTVCRGLLSSMHCVHVENMTKLISGYKKGDDEEDYSFLARANNKTWVTCEFDTILSSHQYTELMGKIRRIFDGETSATYGNSNIDRVYTALRTPWIRAGTFRMMEQDQSQLGDRFIRLIINDPEESEKRLILRSAVRSERAAMLESANGTAGSIVDYKTRRAHGLTGGYVNWLRDSIEAQLASVTIPERAEDRCIDLAELAADLRARPNEDKRRKEAHDCKELPTRLARQNIRLAAHLAVVLNKREVDDEVMGVVRKVALDTAFGHSLNIVRWLCTVNPRSSRTYQESGGLYGTVLQGWLGMSEERTTNYLTFLRKIGVLEFRRPPQTAGMWALTDRMHKLYLSVMED